MSIAVVFGGLSVKPCCSDYFTPQIDHDFDHVDPNLPLRDCVQDLYGTDPTQEMCSTVDHAGCTGPIQQHELGHTDQECICPANT